MVARVLVLFLLASVLTAALGAPPSQAQNIFTVDATGDAGDTRAGDGTCATSGGDCTLRAALEEANATENSGGPDRIEFDIPGGASPGSPHRIEPGSALPNVTDPVVIDGATEPDYNGDKPVLEIDGGSAGSSNGFVVESGGGLDATGLSVVGFDFDAFELEEGSGPNAIRGCFIGVRADGTTTAGNGDGISVGAEDTAIGGAASSEGNVIAGNAISGITLRTSASSPPTTVRGNAIGLDAEGGPAGNGEDGILIIGSNASVGGTGQGEGNVIAHNGGAGARVNGADEGAHVGNEIRGNRIFSNGAIGIDLGTAGFNNTSGPLEGPTENDEGDGDDGPNRLQNFPKIQKASYDASANEVTVTYQVPSNPNESGEGASAYPLTVDLYRADADEEEGEAYLGTDTYSSVSPDDYAGCGSPPCTAAVTFAPASPASEEDEIVATATDDNGNTSEFSVSVPVESPNDPPTAFDDSDETEEGQPTTTDVLANDSDPDGELDPSTVQVQSSPSDGTASANEDGTITYSPDGGFAGTDSYTYTVEDDDGAESGEATVTIEINAPPTVSNVALSSDGAGNLDFSFQTDEQLGSDASDIAVSVDGPNTPDVYSFDRTDFSESGSGPYTYALATTQAYDDGAGTYAVSVDDAVDPDGADGADGTQTGSYTLDAEVSLKDGNDGEPYVPPSTTPGTNANPVGRFRLSADVSGGALSSLTVAQEGAAPSGVDAIELWESEDDTFESGNDLEIASKSYANSVSFSGVSVPIPTGGTYLFIVVDLASDANGDYRPKITEESDIEFEKGELSNVNGTETTNFTDAFLSSEATALPVELVSFDAVTSEHGVVLTWRTASEQKNAGFHVQREKRDGASEWTTIGRREGAGTTAEPQTYRFTDSALPYEADQLFYRLRQVDADGSASYSKTLTVERSVGEVKLLPTRPNPAGDWATVRYAVPEAREVSVRLYDAMGQQVRTVTDGTQKGRHTHRINVTDLASGTYFLRLQAGTQIQTQKLTVLR
jgi:hypothetical protein